MSGLSRHARQTAARPTSSFCTGRLTAAESAGAPYSGGCLRAPDLGQVSAYLRSRVDGVERLSEVVGQGVGGSDGVLAGLYLDSAVAAGGLEDIPVSPAGPVPA